MQETSASKKHLFLVRATRYVQYLVLRKCLLVKNYAYPETLICMRNMYNGQHLYSKHICISYIFYCFLEVIVG
jgi:hypothetical protein